MNESFSEVNNVLKHNLLTCPVSSALTNFLNPVRQVPLMPLSLNNDCLSTDPFQSPIHVSSNSIEKNVSIQENFNVFISKNDCDFQQQAHGIIPEETSQTVLSISLISK